jgi:hypothetical protein
MPVEERARVLEQQDDVYKELKQEEQCKGTAKVQKEWTPKVAPSE